MEQKLQFSVDSALLRELGEKLVETVHLALSELVKNAYDADATEVEVIFENLSNGKSRLKIIDNGIGMNFDAVQKYWMRIATTNKVEKKLTPVFGRQITGAKGIGRFSCRRLGPKLTLITQGTQQGNLLGKQKNIERTKVIFPWNDFEAGSDVTEIVCKGNKDVLDEDYTGTTLIIDDISDEWTNRGISWLKRQLAVLTANRGTKRKGFKEDKGFLLMLTAEDFEGGVRDLREDLLNAGWGTLKAYVNRKNQAVCELNALGLGRRTITSKMSFPALKDVRIEVGIFVEDRDQMRDTTVLSQGTSRMILSQWGGIQVRSKGFRVYPYGDDDWLRIDYDRGLRKGDPKKGDPDNHELRAFAESLRGVDASRSLLNMLSMRNYIGNVEIGEEAMGFEMKANREGFLDSQSVEQLKDFARFAIDWSTILRDYYLRQQVQKEAEKAKVEFEGLVDKPVENHKVVERALDYIDTEIKSVSRVLKPVERRVVEQSIGKATEAIRKQHESNRSELSHLRLIASTSTLLLIFSHEVKSLLSLLEQSKNSLNVIARSLEGDQKKDVLQIGKNFTELNHRLEELLQMTSLINTDKSKSKPDRVALKSKITKVEKVFELITKKYDIEIDHSKVRNNIVIKKILEAELYSILLNILSNSIKSVIAKGNEKKINISAFVDSEETVISIKDTGVGLSPEKFKEVFTPFVSDPEGRLYYKLDEKLNPEDGMIVGTGSGLGLGIVREIVKAHSGRVRFKEPPPGWSAEIEVRLI